MNEIIISEGKTKSLNLSVLSIMMSVLSIFVTIIGFNQKKIVYILIGIIGSIYFGICTYFIVKRTIKTITSTNSVALLTINDQGIIDSSTMASVGFIAWDEIKSVRIVSVLSEKFIGIEVNNLDELMNRIPFIKHGAIKINLRMNLPPVNIRLNSSEHKIEKVLSILTERFEAYNNFR